MKKTENELAKKIGWLDDLPEGRTLQVFSCGDAGEPIFESSGKWLMPLFEFEQFVESGYHGDVCATSKDFVASSGFDSSGGFYAHDTAIGKAAVVLMVRNGMMHIHADLISEIALDYINELNESFARDCRCSQSPSRIEIVYKNKVPRLLCATEDELSAMTNQDEMYRILRRRANLVRGTEISVEHLSCHYGLLRDFSFSLQAGENLLVVGENGAGKTTLLRYLTGNILPEEGQIFIGGKNPRSVQSSSICYVPQQQDSVMFPLSVEEVVSLGLPKNVRDAKKVISSSLARVGCAHLLERSFSSLSGGEKQKVSIARALAQNAKVLLLDEPTSQLDDNARNMVIEILQSLAVKEIPTIIIVTHDSELVKKLGWRSVTISN